MRRFVLLLIWLSALAGGRAPAAGFLHALWQTSEGLPHNSVTMTLQDRHGYLWVATQSGLARFDGVKFEVFTIGDGLPGNRILSLMESRDGRLWVGTERGVAYRDKGHWQLPGGDWPKESIWCMAEAADGAIWLGTEDGCHRYDGREARPFPTAAVDQDVRALLPVGDDGGIWLLYRAELFRWGDGVAVRDEAFTALAAGRELWHLAKAPDGTIWACGRNLLARQDPHDGAWRDVSDDVPHCDGLHIRLLAADDGDLWLATRNRGLALLRNGEWRAYDAAQGLAHDDVRDIHMDREANLWISTNGGGLSQLAAQRIEVFGLNEGLGRQVTSGLAMDASGTILAATDGGGVLKFDGGAFTPALPDGLLPEGYIWSLLSARDGSLFVGTFRHGLLRWKDGEATWIRTGDGLTSNWIPSLMEARDGAIWIGTQNGGVHRWHDGRLERLSGSSGSGDSITALLESRNGDVWAATAGYGLMRWQNHRMTRYGERDGLPGGLVAALHEDQAGKLWVGTGGRGLFRFDGESFSGWTAADGFASDTIQQIQTDALGNLWLGTDRGLQRVAIAELPAAGESRTPVRGTTFSRPDGLPTPQFTGGHGNLCLRDTAGRLWFSNAAGAVRVDPAAVAVAAGPAPTIIEEVTSRGTGVWHFERHAPPDEATPLVLAPGTRSLQINFTATQLRAPGKLRFRHRLHGVDDDWQDAGNNRTASYASLAPGRYRFELIAANHEGAWNDTAASLEFLVSPFFWQTGGFRILALAASIGLLAMVVRWWSLRRVRLKIESLRQESRIDKERSRIARDLHDDLGACLTEVNFLGTLAAAAADPPMQARLDGIVERARRMAKSLDEIVWTVNPSNDTLESTVSYLASRTRESLDAAGIRSRFEITKEIPAIRLDSERRHHLLLAVNEAVNNIMKHSGAATASLRVATTGDSLELWIQDDGLGFDPASVPGGRNGLQNIRRRMEIGGGHCTIESTPGAGTRVRLSLPFSPSHPRTPGQTHGNPL